MYILGETHKLNLDNLLYWVSSRQMSYEGGFQGRTNKLVDSCYSFWQGGIYPILHKVFIQNNRHRDIVNIIKEYEKNEKELEKLKQQKESKLESKTVTIEVIDSDSDDDSNNELNFTEGGWLFNQRVLQDYLLVCCQENNGGYRDKPGKNRDYYHTCYALSGFSIAQHSPYSLPIVEGEFDNLLKEINPIHNVRIEKVEQALNYFNNLPTPTLIT